MTPRLGYGALIISTTVCLVACKGTVDPCDPPTRCIETTENWSEGAPLPFNVMEFGATTLNEAIYIGGGLDIGTVEAVDSFFRYDPGIDTWTTLPPMPGRRNLLALVAVADSIYAIGGQSEQLAIGIESNLWVYDVDADQWHTRASLPNAWAGGGAVAVGGEIIVIGGFGLNSAPQSAVLIYNPTTNSWREGTIIPTTRQRLAVATIGSLVYAIGGRSLDPGTEFNIVEVYDSNSDSWATGIPLTVVARAGLASAVLDGDVHVFGGVGDNAIWNIHQVFDPASSVWTTMPDGMPTGRFELRAAALGGLIYTMGGVSLSGADAQLEIYEPNP